MNDFIHKLTFIGGVLADIETLRYGGYLKEEEPATPSASSAQKGSTEESQAATGKVDIVGGPAGAKVYLDDFYTCDLPCVIEEVEPGTYHLIARHEGYNEWREKILVRGDSTLWLRVYLQQERPSGLETGGGEEESQPPKRLFKWTDEGGRVHITDDPPPASEHK
jgi:hypothetical protein